ncbi:hypothetical protein [Shewanella gelidii]|nr:hypothetical protein [Shewanella gelidii]
MKRNRRDKFHRIHRPKCVDGKDAIAKPTWIVLAASPWGFGY